MDAQDLAGYLGRLLGRPVAIDERVKLSSGQRARVAGWLVGHGVTPDQKALSVAFQALEIVAMAPAPPVQGTPTAGDPSPGGPPSAKGGIPPGMRIGIDIQSVDELCDVATAFDPKAAPELRALFTLREMSYAQSRPEPRETLTGLFAAKEALRKCDAALLAQSLTAIEILPDVAGRPTFAGYSLSISHSGGFAIAVAAAVQLPPGASPAETLPTTLASAAVSTGTAPVAPTAAAPPRPSKALVLAAAAVVGLLIYGGLTLMHVLTATR